MKLVSVAVLALFLLPGLAAAQDLSAVFVRASDESFARPHDLVLSPDGRRLYVADLGNDAVKVLDPVSLATLGAIGRDTLDSPHDVAFAPDGRLLVADTGNDRIAVFALEGDTGRLVESWSDGMASPEGVVADPDGRVFVTNAAGHDVLALRDGKVTARAGRRGGGPNEYVRPHDIDLGPDGRLYLSDPGNNRIQVLDKGLAFLAELGGPAYDFHEPKYFALDDKGRLFVADEYNHQIKVLDETRRRLLTLGAGRPGKGPGLFNYPEGAEVRGQDLWISDTRNGRILHYRLTEAR
jgi:YVTN family beta-propeller protein